MTAGPITLPAEYHSILPSMARAQVLTRCGSLSRGGNADYYGITWEKIEQNNGILWPPFGGSSAYATN